jgi:hypothetical protein
LGEVKGHFPPWGVASQSRREKWVSHREIAAIEESECSNEREVSGWRYCSGVENQALQFLRSASSPEALLAEAMQAKMPAEGLPGTSIFYADRLLRQVSVSVSIT